MEYKQFIPFASRSHTLKELLIDHGLVVGTSFEYGNIAVPGVKKHLLHNFNSITAETAMKMNVVNPEDGVWVFTRAQNLYNFVRQNGLQMHGHTLVWGPSTPAWVRRHSGDVVRLRAIMRTFITTMMTRYADIKHWDVVNEPWKGDGTPVTSVWSSFDYITYAFQTARSVLPGRTLYLNTYFGGEALQNRILDLARRRIIDAVGIQHHLTQGTWETVIPDLRVFVARLADLGVTYRITEMDARVYIPQPDLYWQERMYADTVDLCMHHGFCTGLTFWGCGDRFSWIPGTYGNDWGQALPFDKDLKEKPLYKQMVKTALNK